MKSIESAFNCIKEGAILKINQIEIKGQKEYVGCIMCYDGEVEKDVKGVQLGDFLKIVPNITSKLDQDGIYELRYNRETKMYESIILKKIKEFYDGYKQIPILEMVDDLITRNKILYDSIIDLDIKIANQKQKNKGLYKRKVS